MAVMVCAEGDVLVSIAAIQVATPWTELYKSEV
jgi:hypothetical protein